MADAIDDPFALLGLPRAYRVDAAAVRAAYLARSGEVHPDRSSGDLEDAEARAAALNRARRLLEDPELRANELLRLLGGPAKEQDRSLPPGFLAEMMDIRERIDAERAGTGRLGEWEKWGSERRALHQANVEKMFGEAGSEGQPDGTVLRRIRTELNAWRYIERMMEQLADADH